MQLPNPIAWTPSGGIRLLDQTLLPGEERYLELETVDAVAEAISSLRVRGAPLIGIAAAMGVTLAVRRSLRGRTTRSTTRDARWRRLAPPARPRSTCAGRLRRMERRAERAVEAWRAAGGGPARRGAGDLGRGPRDVRADRRARRRAGPGRFHRGDHLQRRRARHRRDRHARSRRSTTCTGSAARPRVIVPETRPAAPGEPAHRLGAEPCRCRVHRDRPMA